ncbi:hypothetical protein SBA4_1430015 [Candidatus Sulfopaludibacter sp. SbA4]|nr:hypothetical protein SBA4_1430015 [Candidatus Sulfopaludibacter sp. SbA4]
MDRMAHEIVLDTNVLVAGLRSKRGASYELVRSIGRAGWRLNVSVGLALERSRPCPGPRRRPNLRDRRAGRRWSSLAII